MAPYRGAYYINNQVRPCCWYDRNAVTNNRASNLIDVVNVFNGETFDALREDPSAGCWECIRHERAGGKSHRMLWNERHEDDGQARLTSLDLYMGNLCNLACTMCSSNNSSKWISEERDIWGKSFKNTQDQIDITLDWNTVKDLERIKLAGGEITIMPQHVPLLQQLIDFDVAKNITLVYVVNSTTDPRQFEQLWSNFKSIEMIVSLDGIELLNDYIRYHSKWEIISTNIQRAVDMGIKISANCVVSILNVYHLPEIFAWWNDKGDILFRILNYPNELSIINLKQEYKDMVTTKLSTHLQFNHVLEHMVSDTGDWNKFIEWVTPVDNNRNIKWQEVNSQFE